MSDTKTISKSYITHNENNQLIYMRTKDGYVNATAMCKATGKEWKHYNELESTKAFLKELSEVEKCDIKASARMTTTALVYSIQGGHPELQGTWIHPQVAINLGQWLSPIFAVRVSKWILDWMNGKTSKSNEKFIPHHLRRYYLNDDRIPKGYFSVLQEMTIMVFGKFEILGYLIPSNIVPDISEGRLFAKWMRDQGVDTDDLPTYNHRYEDGRIFPAKLYPHEYLVAFKSHVENIWLPEKAHKYFKERDTEALPFLEKALQISEALTLKTIANA